ncbi:lantibiotic dehydratase [Streptomyces mirabilis]|uniref:lantibiotic dehydratase n=1 Tax=Streptomyces mirabilis TaxID=68239 RepID=UPI00368C22D2
MHMPFAHKDDVPGMDADRTVPGQSALPPDGERRAMTPVFQAPRSALARLSLLPFDGAAPTLPEDMDDAMELRAFLARVAEDSMTREAIAVSSLSLDGALDKVVTGAPLRDKQLRRGAAAAARYLSRMRCRATPFGLMAGVAPVRFSENAEVRIEDGHRKYVRPDSAWLTEVLRELRRDPLVLAELRVMANDLCSVQGDRLVMPCTLAQDGPQHPEPRELFVPYGALVRTAMDAARTPVRHSALVELLRTTHPEEHETAIAATLSALVEQEFLLTELFPPATSPDPIRRVLSTLTPVRDLPALSALERVSDALDRYAAAPVGNGHARFLSAARAMCEIRATDRPVNVDLGMDADLALPRQVAAELGDAASMAWRLARPQPPLLAEYHAAFCERYGLRGIVPVKELLDPHSGLGAPIGYLAPPSHRRPGTEPRADTRHDDLLCGLAQHAAARGDREVILDAELAERLARPGAEDEPATFIEPLVRVFADSAEHLQTGDFRLLLSPMNYTRPGALSSRFLHLLPQLRDPIAACVRDLSDDWKLATAAQLLGPTVEARQGNVAQVPQILEDTLAIGVFTGDAGPHVLRLDDLAIGAQRDRLFVTSLRTGEEIVPLMLNANNSRTTAPNALRLLYEIGVYHTPRWKLWSWGTIAERLPFLPRIRYSRTVLSPARWLPDTPLADPALSWTAWQRAFTRWCKEWAVPEKVEVAHGDQLLPLDLGSSGDLRLLRDEMRRSPDGVMLKESPLGGEYGTGWAGGRAVELAVPLIPVPQRPLPAARSALPVKTAADPALMRRESRPGGDWLYLQVHADTDRHDEIICRHLPALLDLADGVADRWFFIRYTRPEPHLRIRFHGASGEVNTRLLPAVHNWANQLADAGSLREISLHTYRPEIARYGGPDAIEWAERAFFADSRAAVEQLTLREQGLLDLPVELLLAANYLDLTSRVVGEGWHDWLLASYPKDEEHHPMFQRYRRDAVELLSPLLEPGTSLQLSAGKRLAEVWERRAAPVIRYGEVIRELMAEGRMGTAPAPYRSILHMHHNRLAGVDSRTEQGSYAIARGVLQTLTDRKTHRLAEPHS